MPGINPAQLKAAFAQKARSSQDVNSARKIGEDAVRSLNLGKEVQQQVQGAQSGADVAKAIEGVSGAKGGAQGGGGAQGAGGAQGGGAAGGASAGGCSKGCCAGGNCSQCSRCSRCSQNC